MRAAGARWRQMSDGAKAIAQGPLNMFAVQRADLKKA